MTADNKLFRKFYEITNDTRCCGPDCEPQYLVVSAISCSTSMKPFSAHKRRTHNSKHIRPFSVPAGAGVDTLSLAPPIILNGEADNLIGNGSYQQAAQAEYTLALSSVIELGGQREPVTSRHYRPTNSQTLRVSPGPYRY